MRRILILYISSHSGHYRAARALKEAFKIIEPDCKIIAFDGLKYLHPFSSRVINYLYGFTLKNIPSLWRIAYDRETLIKGLNPFKQAVHYFDFPKIEKVIREFRPQIVVTTQAFPCGVMAYFKMRSSFNFYLVGVVTDYWPHGFWIYPEVDKYIVASEEAVGRLVEQGIRKDKIELLGIPIMPKFSQSVSPEKVAGTYGFELGKPALLIMGGGLGIGPIEEVVEALDSSTLDFQMITVCGKNEKLYNWFKDKKFNKPLYYFGYSYTVDKFMSFADIIITKAGGITISEALAKKLAIVVVNPLPGQEENNVRFLKERGLILKADKPSLVVKIVEDLLRDRNLLNELKERGYRFSFPRASLDIAEFLLKEKTTARNDKLGTL